MLKTTRFFFITAIIMLIVAMSLHLAVLFGSSRLWSAMIYASLFGWITAMICGVNYHTMPVFTGRDFPKPRLIWLHGISVAGSAVFGTLGYGFGWKFLILFGLGLGLLGAITFTVNIVTLLKAPEQRPRPLPPSPRQPMIDKFATLATKISGSSLLLALLLMLTSQFGWLRGEWFLAAEHLTTLGWIGMMIIGVAYHMLPRFNRNGLQGMSLIRGQMISYMLGLSLIVLSLGFGWHWGFVLGASVVSLSLIVFTWIIAPTLQKVRPVQGMIALTPKEQQ